MCYRQYFGAVSGVIGNHLPGVIGTGGSDYKVQVFFDLYLEISQKLHLYLIGNPFCLIFRLFSRTCTLQAIRNVQDLLQEPKILQKKWGQKQLVPYRQPKMCKTFCRNPKFYRFFFRKKKVFFRKIFCHKNHRGAVYKIMSFCNLRASCNFFLI